MLAVGRRSLLAVNLQRKAAAGKGRVCLGKPSHPESSSSLGAIRTVVVPYVPVARKKKYKSQSGMVRRRMRRARAEYNKPTLDVAKAMPVSCQEMDNSALVTLGGMGDYDARKEILKRHIMAKDDCSYEEASDTFEKIYKKNQEYVYFLSLPYHLGIGAGLLGALGSIPMVFDLNTAAWFNAGFVTTDVPEPADLETWLEVGSWTWNWMEPPLGTISFILLCLQFSRSQLQNLGIKPYTNRVKRIRAVRLAQAFPRYDAKIVMDYSESAYILHHQ